ncbi:MAG: cupin domain-containing protein [Clostridia bacterium]|nr:cupin domain-containing protein [Clostridia bacterium]
MIVILLSGGSGMRLWPLSNEVRSKQFIKIFNDPTGKRESMVQRVYRQLKTVDPDCSVTVATARSQIPAILNHLGKKVHISIEPCRRDTFPAIVLATAYLHDVMGIPEDEVAVVCPVDPYVELGYFEALKRMDAQAAKGEANLVLMGIEPTYPSKKYGYIIPNDCGAVSTVKMFKEKPDAAAAQEYIAGGALWNGGVFAYKLKYMLNRAKELLNCTKYQELYDHYEELPKISFDYAVVEKEPSIQVIRYRGEWKDVGTWNTMVEAMHGNTLGHVILNEQCENVHVLNELEVPVLAMNVQNLIISASPQGILVTEKHASAHIKPFVGMIDQRARFYEKAWGEIMVLDVGESSMTLRLKLIPGGTFRYHRHELRDESWTVVEGTGEAVVNDQTIPLHPGSVVNLPRGCMHNLVAYTHMTVIEIMCGEKLSDDDYIKFPRDEKRPHF